MEHAKVNLENEKKKKKKTWTSSLNMLSYKKGITVVWRLW